MNISYNWLKDLIEIELVPEELAKQLTRVGLAVEGIEPKGDDFVFDIDLTSNRPDCLSHLGVARELQAISNSRFQIPDSRLNENLQSAIPNPQSLVTIESPDICHRFTVRIIRNVKIGPSPEWMVKRLEAIGQRSINNVADITNYVMHELGNPMHAFDLAKLAENRIVVRKAKPGETMQTLDEVERKFDEEMLLICDAVKPVAVGGVMGGLHSGISDNTSDVLLEVAYFKRDNIRRTSRKLGLATEAAYRFERGVDIENLINASNRATQLICELAGGTPAEFVDVYPQRKEEVIVSLRPERVTALTGLDVETEEVKRILTALGFAANTEATRQDGSGHRLSFSAPSWRHDIEREEDLVEEVARHVGYENIKEELPPAYGAGEYQPSEPLKKALRKSLNTLGFDEAISYSFISESQDEKFEFVPGLIDQNLQDKFVTLQDSIIEGAVRMRSTMLSGLLDAIRTNFNFGRRDLKLFEIGKVFAAEGENPLPKEKELFAFAITGGEIGEGKAMPLRELDFYDAKGALEEAVNSLNLAGISLKAANIKHLRPGQSAEVLLNSEKVGYIGRLADSIAAEYKFKQPVFVAEVDLEKLLTSEKAVVAYKPLPTLPSSTRDVSLLSKRSVTFEQLKNAVIDQKIELCRRVEFVDVYEGKGVADDERSITLRLEYRNDERTLLDEEVDAMHEAIIKTLESKLAIKRRF